MKQQRGRRPSSDTGPAAITTDSVAFVAFVTQYAARSYEELIREVYAPGREPGGYLRWREQEAARERLAAHRARLCAVRGCTRLREAREWCGMHYARWWRTGYPLGMEDPRWQAEHPPQPVPTPAEVVAEMREALAHLGAVVERAEGRVSGGALFDLATCQPCALYGGDDITKEQWVALGCPHVREETR